MDGSRTLHGKDDAKMNFLIDKYLVSERIKGCSNSKFLESYFESYFRPIKVTSKIYETISEDILQCQFLKLHFKVLPIAFLASSVAKTNGEGHEVLKIVRRRLTERTTSDDDKQLQFRG